MAGDGPNTDIPQTGSGGRGVEISGKEASAAGPTSHTVRAIFKGSRWCVRSFSGRTMALACPQGEDSGRQWPGDREGGHRGASGVLCGLGDSHLLFRFWCHTVKMAHQALWNLREAALSTQGFGVRSSTRDTQGCSRSDAGGSLVAPACCPPGTLRRREATGTDIKSADAGANPSFAPY